MGDTFGLALADRLIGDALRFALCALKQKGELKERARMSKAGCAI